MVFRSLTILFPLIALQGQINFPPDLTISRVEVTQAIQDDAHQVPLTAGKATAVRVFIRQEGRPESLIANVSAALRGFKGGTELTGSPLRPINPAITARPAPDRNNATHSQNFILPPAWTDAGTIELRAELRLPAGTVEIPADNNSLSREVEFRAPSILKPFVAWIPLCVAGNCASSSFAHTRFLERAFPFADGTLRYEDVPVPALTWTGPLNDDAAMSALSAHLRRWKLLLDDSPAPPHVLVGYAPNGTLSVSPSFGSDDAFWVTDQLGADGQLAARIASGFQPVSPDPCGAFLVDPGFDPLTGAVIAGSRLEFTARCDSNRNGFWVSPDLERYLQSGLPAFSAPRQDSSGKLLISGFLGDNSALTSVLRVSARVRSTLAQSTPYAIRVSSSEGVLEHGVALTEGLNFTLSVPYSGAVNNVALLRDGQVVASLEGTGSTPTVAFSGLNEGEAFTGTRTLRWDAADPVGRPLKHSLFYSNDGGSSWYPLALDLTTPSFTLDTRFLDGDQVLFRVAVTAGLEQIESISPPVNINRNPSLQLSSSTLDFGSITVGQIADRTLNVRNTGSGWLDLSAFRTSKDQFVPAVVEPLRVRPLSERPLTLRYVSRLSGSDTAELTFNSNDAAAGANALSLRATVFERPVPSVAISTSSLDYGEVPSGQTRDLTFVVRNDGPAPLTVNSLAVIGARFNIVQPLGSFTLESGAERQATVRFSPNASAGFTAAVTVNSNDPSVPSLRVELRGSGITIPQPQLDISPLSLDFGGVNLSQLRNLAVNVRNGGNAPLQVTAVTFTNPIFSLTSAPAPFTVAPGATQVLSVRFTPTNLGAQSGILTLESNDPQRASVTITLAGTGLTAVSSPQPRISSLIPAALVARSPRFQVTVNGTNFVGGSQVQWNGVARPTTFVSSTLLRASIPAEDLANTGTATVSVTNPSPGGGLSNALPVVISPTGSGAQIVNFELGACPVVLTNMTVHDQLYTPITALNSGNVVCTEDGTTVPCTIFKASTQNSAFSVVLALHTSVSVENPPQQRLDVGNMVRFSKAFADGMDLNDRAAVTQFDNGVRLVRDFTTAENRDALINAIDGVQVPFGTGTALYDAIEDGIRRLSTQTGRRKAMVIFIGAENSYDTAGPRDLDALTLLIQTSGVALYFVPLGAGNQNPNLVNLLNQLALDSGGLSFAATPVDPEPLMQRLAAATRDQMQVNHSTLRRDGQPHQLRVNLSVPGASFSAARSFNGCR